MPRHTRTVLFATAVVAMAMMTSGCELSLPVVDCSGINQPDMGGLVCFGLNVVAVSAGALAVIVAILLALGGPLPA
jgi:hypothetical protein